MNGNSVGFSSNLKLKTIKICLEDNESTTENQQVEDEDMRNAENTSAGVCYPFFEV